MHIQTKAQDNFCWGGWKPSVIFVGADKSLKWFLSWRTKAQRDFCRGGWKPRVIFVGADKSTGWFLVFKFCLYITLWPWYLSHQSWRYGTHLHIIKVVIFSKYHEYITITWSYTTEKVKITFDLQEWHWPLP